MPLSFDMVSSLTTRRSHDVLLAIWPAGPRRRNIALLRSAPAATPSGNRHSCIFHRMDHELRQREAMGIVARKNYYGLGQIVPDAPEAALRVLLTGAAGLIASAVLAELRGAWSMSRRSAQLVALAIPNDR
jgi:hypothetical protein